MLAEKESAENYYVLTREYTYKHFFTPVVVLRCSHEHLKVLGDIGSHPERKPCDLGEQLHRARLWSTYIVKYIHFGGTTYVSKCSLVQVSAPQTCL